VAFNENEEPQELKIIIHLPHLHIEVEEDEYSKIMLKNWFLQKWQYSDTYTNYFNFRDTQ